MKNKMKNYSMTMMASIALCLLLAAAQSASAQGSGKPPNPTIPKDQQIPQFADSKVKVIINFESDKGHYENGFLGACSDISVRVNYLIKANNKSVPKQIKANPTGPGKMAKNGECTALITIPPFLTYTLSAGFDGDLYYGALDVTEKSKPGETAVYTITMGHYKP